MNSRSVTLGCGVLVLAVALVGCATSNDYDIDVDALLQQLEMEAGMGPSVAAVPAPVPVAPVTPVAAAVPVAVTSPTTGAVKPAVKPAVPAVPAAAVPQGELTIQPDCLVQISVAEDPALNGSYPVNEIGAVKLGYVGPVILYNKTEAQAAAKIKDILTSRHFRNATVQVRIIRASYDKVRIGGEVVASGLIKIGAGDSISLNDALLRAGGLKPTAKGAKIKVVRNGLRSAVAATADGEVYALTDASGMPAMPEVELRNNDVAFVFIPVGDSDTPVREGGAISIVVLGQLQQPGIYRFKAGQPCSMMYLMFRVAGQMTPYANRKKVIIIRKNDKGWDEETRVNVERLMKDGDPSADVPLQNGDRVVIPKRKISLF
jgi:protein involved in polysaccharide export with SLBB domain